MAHTVVHRAGERGRGSYGWLETRYSFSFADWHEPTRMGFGALRVINDDAIAPATGFGPHGHRDMEIVTIVTAGAVTHEDSLGNKGVVKAGEVQVMSAGTGVVHAERNDSAEEPLTLLQIWIEPSARGLAPRYAQRAFSLEAPGATLLVAPMNEAERAGGLGMDSTGSPPAAPLAVNQEAYITLVNLGGEPYTYHLKSAAHGAYVFVLSGEVVAAGEALGPRDALGATGTNELLLQAPGPASVLVFEVPM